ncbi:MAG: CvpA family protein, partial [Clostridia bacterium]|nr:CvpA family protein [Clostridia bacterium]
MAYVLDLLVILVFGLMVFIGYKRGVVKSLARLIGLIAAVVVAITFSGPVANAVYDGAVGPAIEEAVAAKIDEGEDATSIELRSGVESVLEALPTPLLNLMKNNHIGTVDEIMAKVEDSEGLDKLFNAGELAETLTEKVVRPVAVTILRLLAFLLL